MKIRRASDFFSDLFGPGFFSECVLMEDSRSNPCARKADAQAVIAQCRLLLSLLSAADWKFDSATMPESIRYFTFSTNSEAPDVIVPTGGHYAEIAFYTDVLSQSNVESIATFDESGRPVYEFAAQPNGSWIVGFRDGRIVQVQSEDVRMLPGVEGYDYCFPGMAVYDPELPCLPSHALEGKPVQIPLPTDIP